MYLGLKDTEERSQRHDTYHILSTERYKTKGSH